MRDSSESLQSTWRSKILFFPLFVRYVVGFFFIFALLYLATLGIPGFHLSLGGLFGYAASVFLIKVMIDNLLRRSISPGKPPSQRGRQTRSSQKFNPFSAVRADRLDTSLLKQCAAVQREQPGEGERRGEREKAAGEEEPGAQKKNSFE